MNPNQLKETTMDPATRSLIRITLPAEYQDRQPVKDLVDRLMGKNPEHRFNFIQANAANLERGRNRRLGGWLCFGRQDRLAQIGIVNRRDRCGLGMKAECFRPLDEPPVIVVDPVIAQPSAEDQALQPHLVLVIEERRTVETGELEPCLALVEAMDLVIGELAVQETILQLLVARHMRERVGSRLSHTLVRMTWDVVIPIGPSNFSPAPRASRRASVAIRPAAR